MWILQCREHRERPQGIHPSKAPKDPKKKHCDVVHVGKEKSFALTTQKSKTVNAYKCEAQELTRMRTTETQNKDHEDHIAERGFNSLSHYNLAYKFIFIAPGNENSRCKGRS